MRENNLKYFLYARKSSESEDRQMASIEDQVAEVKKVAERLKLEIVDVIKESKSAKEPGRKSFNLMLQRIHKGEAQGILTWKLNRLARNPVDGGQISWMLQQNIIQHIQTFERDYNPSDNVLLMQVEFGMANQFVKDLSVDVKRGMRKKAERGWCPVVRLPIGYIHNRDYKLGVDNEIILNQEQFRIVKILWGLILSGDYSIADMKRKGDTMGLRNRNGKVYSLNTYQRIFKNEFYCGYFYCRNENNDLVRYTGKHKAVVSSNEFQKVQDIMKKREHWKNNSKKYNFPYRKIITCGECSCTIIADHKLQVICANCKHKYSIKTKTTCPKCKTELSEMNKPSIIDVLYYHCRKRKGKCSQGSITKERIEETIENELRKISIDEKVYSWAMNFLENEKEKKADKNLTKQLKKKKTELENRIDNLIRMRADNEINSKLFNSSMNKAQKENSLLEIEIENTENQNINWLEKTKKDYDFALNSLEIFKNGNNTEKTEIVKELCSNLKLLDKKLYYTTNKSLLDLENIDTPHN